MASVAVWGAHGHHSCSAAIELRPWQPLPTGWPASSSYGTMPTSSGDRCLGRVLGLGARIPQLPLWGWVTAGRVACPQNSRGHPIETPQQPLSCRMHTAYKSRVPCSTLVWPRPGGMSPAADLCGLCESRPLTWHPQRLRALRLPGPETLPNPPPAAHLCRPLSP